MKRVGILLLAVLMGQMLLGQETSTLSTRATRLAGDRQTASKYILSATSDALLMTVKIWGEVQRPGLYDVPIGTDLIELISAAGGPTVKANLSKVKVIRSGHGNKGNEVTTVSVKEYLETGDATIIPEIRPYDTIIVPIKPSQYFLTSLSWTQQFLSLISIYAMITYYIGIAKKTG